MPKTFLKVHIKSLASTSGFLRLEENKALDKARLFLDNSYREENEHKEDDATKSDAYYRSYHYLHNHRVNLVRREARHSLLAYGFLRGRPYSSMEVRDDVHEQPDWKKVEQMVFRFTDDDPRIVQQRWAEWLSEAKGQ